MHTAAIIPAAGFGSRLKNRTSKPLVEIQGIPIIVYTLKAISEHPLIKEVIVVANPSNIGAIKHKIKQHRIKKISKVILGGETRRCSVENGLNALSGTADFVLIHDAVRPFIRRNIISAVIKEAQRRGAAIVGVPVKATIKQVSSLVSQVSNRRVVEKTIDRRNIWEIQTPQVFRKDFIIKAYKKFKDKDVTDDAMLVEKMGGKVSMVLGSYDNIKVTTPEDLILAEAICRNLRCHTE